MSETTKPSYRYMSGFGNEFASEAEPGALPEGQNNPQKCPLGLYAEQLTGTAFTVPRARNQRSWLYRIRPSVVHRPATPVAAGDGAPLLQTEFGGLAPEPNQLRWSPPALDAAELAQRDWVQGLETYAGTGDASMKSGAAIHYYRCGKSMEDTSFYNADGDLLIVPQHGALDIQTEFGMLYVEPNEICVIQRGMVFAVRVSGPSRGYVCEIYGGHLQLPDLGPIGANGLANPRDFETPVAHYERMAGPHRKRFKYGGALFEAALQHSPFDVVAWHGNYAPYKYDLRKYVAMNSVTVDHPDPSIFTVLTCPTTEPGVAALDFVIFPPRWMVAEHTFRPPYFHRNLMSEFMGLIGGVYDAKEDTKGGGFQPGGASLHSCMTPHGPDAVTTKAAASADLKPVRYPDGAIAFMFESTYLFKPTDHARQLQTLQGDYFECWQDIADTFTPPEKK